MTPLTSVFVVSTSAVFSAVTVTDATVPAGFRTASTVTRDNTLTTTSSCSNFAKFDASTSRRYVPGTSCGISYVPSPLVCAVRDTFVPILIKVTVAPGTTAPFSSFTTPVSVPVLEVCAATLTLNKQTATTKSRNFFIFGFLSWKRLVDRPGPEKSRSSDSRGCELRSALIEEPSIFDNSGKDFEE